MNRLFNDASSTTIHFVSKYPANIMQLETKKKANTLKCFNDFY